MIWPWISLVCLDEWLLVSLLKQIRKNIHAHKATMLLYFMCISLSDCTLFIPGWESLYDKKCNFSTGSLMLLTQARAWLPVDADKAPFSLTSGCSCSRHNLLNAPRTLNEPVTCSDSERERVRFFRPWAKFLTVSNFSHHAAYLEERILMHHVFTGTYLRDWSSTLSRIFSCMRAASIMVEGNGWGMPWSSTVRIFLWRCFNKWQSQECAFPSKQQTLSEEHRGDF